jgi:hypothetical protein
MTIKIALNPFRDPAEGVDWSEQATKARQQIAGHLQSYSDGEVDFSISEGEHGIGLDMPVLILEVLGIGTTLFFGIPAFHKKIREAIQEWKKIVDNVEKLLQWMGSRVPVTSHSIEVAFYRTLGNLESLTNVADLELVEAVEYKGKSGAVLEGFEYSPFAYYWFVFREGDERLFVVLIDSYLRRHFQKILSLDYRMLKEDEREATI